MSVAPACPPSLPSSAAADSGDPSPRPEVPRPAETCGALQPPEAEEPPAEPAASPLPDSSTSPSTTLPSSPEASGRKEEGKVPARKLKAYTVLSKMQLCVLKDHFQRQKYLSLQQMQELSSLLNLSYKQVKNWFQNQRMRWKRWQKSTGLQNGAGAPEKFPAPAEYPGFCSNYAQSFLVNTSENLPMWGNQTWNDSAWCSQSWGNHSWNSETWNMQRWCPQAWDSPFPSCREESLQQGLHFPQNFPASYSEAILEADGNSHKYFNTSQESLQPCLPFLQNFPSSDLQAMLKAVRDNYKYFNTPQESLQPCLPFLQNFPSSDLQAMFEAVGDSHKYNTPQDTMQPCLPFSQNFPSSSLEAMLEALGDHHKYCNTPQALDLCLNYVGNLQPEDL